MQTVSNPVFCEKRKYMPICRRLKMLPRVLSVNINIYIYIILGKTETEIARKVTITVHVL